jgi:hypothetical protein
MKTRTTLILTIVCLVLSHTILAQKVEIISQSDFQPIKKQKDLAFIEPKTDTTGLKFVATIKSSGEGKKAALDVLFYTVKYKAQKLGANTFKLKSFEKNDSLDAATLTLDVYYAADSLLNINFDNHEKNVVYIFGDFKESEKIYSFKLDNEKKELKGGTFYRYVNEEGREVRINKGGFSGATVWIKWEENKPASFLSMTGFGLGTGPAPAGQIGISFNSGRLNYIDTNLGHLLVSLLHASE